MARHTLPLLLLVAATAAAGALACTETRIPTAQPPPPPPPPTSFAILPVLDTVAAGDSAFFVAEPEDSTVVTWSVSDTNMAYPLPQPGGRAILWGGTPGIVTVRATRGGEFGEATLVVTPQPVLPPETFGDWEAIDLGLMDGCGGNATDINDNGTIVGWLYGPCYFLYGTGFIYQDGVMRKLPSSSGMPTAIGPSGKIAGVGYGGPIVWNTPEAVPRQLDGVRLTRILGVNERGDVLGVEELGSTNFSWGRSVMWRQDLRVELGELGDPAVHYRPSTWATAWNSRGEVVGKSRVAGDSVPSDPAGIVYHAFLWKDGVTRDLGVLAPILPCTRPHIPTDVDCGWSIARDINAHSVIVGVANDAAGMSRAVVWENGVIRELGVYPGRPTSASAINDRGQILGTIHHNVWWSSVEVSGLDTTFLWDNGQVQVIATDVHTYGIALGPNGEVIGSMVVGGETHAFVWEAGHLTDLGRLQDAGYLNAINGRSEIVGQRYINGRYRPTLWRKKRS